MENLQNYKKNVTSQWGEDGIIQEIFKRIGTSEKNCVEFGAWNGKHLSNTWNLWYNKEWSAILIESAYDKARELAKNSISKNAKVINAFVRPDGANSLDSILERCGCRKKIDLMSIDIDENEYHIFKSIEKFLPRVVVIEYNPTFPPYVSFIQKQDQFMGSSARALCDLAEKKGYWLAALTDTNLIFVNKKEFEFLKIAPQRLEDIFNWKRIVFIATSYNGIPFLGGQLSYLSLHPHKSIFGHIGLETSPIPQFESDTLLIPVYVEKNTSGIFFFRTGLKNRLKKILKKVYLHKLVAFFLDIEKNAQSILRNKIKQGVVKKYAQEFKCSVFVETDTYKGDMVNAVKNIFPKIYSVELSPELFKKAGKRFLGANNIDLRCGDSGILLKQIVQEIKVPALFWLDAHYSKGNTARGEKDTPILQELETVLSHPIKNHTILIDDARCFNGINDYPKISKIEAFIAKKAPHYTVKVANDIIRITNPNLNKNQ
ncbi:MAG: FkbM family methyltransferase [Elusimicrobia bacterium]|nr:FkbM family methyltransferase [Elusimicrobiota bacterium]